MSVETGRELQENFKILYAEDSEQSKQWSALFSKLPSELKDLHYLPEYGMIYHATYGQKPFAAVLSTPNGMLLQAFVQKKLTGLEFLRGAARENLDSEIANPYGFGGPLAVADGESKINFDIFEKNLKIFGEEKQIAAEFTQVTPFQPVEGFLRGCGVSLQKLKEMVVVDLTLSASELEQGLSRGCKSNVNKAKRAGVHVESVACTSENLALFQELYLKTMERQGATKRWIFPASYFQNCVRFLGDEKTALFFAKIGPEVVAAHFVLHGFNTAYYHFGASDEKYFESRATNLLMWEIILWAKQKGYKNYNLGGGVSNTEDDNLLRFKAGFSKKRASLYGYGRVLSEESYQALEKLKLDFEKRHKLIPRDPHFFPVYKR